MTSLYFLTQCIVFFYFLNALTAQSNLVRAAQVTIADEDANVEWFDTDTFNPLHNGGHHATTGQLQVGNAFADTYLASAGTPAVSPPSTPPPARPHLNPYARRWWRQRRCEGAGLPDGWAIEHAWPRR